MNNNFRVAFYLGGRTRKDGKETILYRISVGYKRLQMGSTGHSVLSSLWSTNQSRVVGDTNEARFINSELDNMESDLRTIFRRMEFSESFSLEKIKEAYLHQGEQSISRSFLSYFDNTIKLKEEEVGRGIVLGTVKKYRTTRKCFEEFLNKKLKRKDVSFSEINYKLIMNFERYLRVETGIQNNTVVVRLKCIRAVIHEAMREGILPDDPTKDVQMSFSPVDRGFLTEEEVMKLMNYEFEIERLEKVRDFFVFSCFTGLAYTDLAALTYKNIVEMGDRTWIVKSREKTKVASNVPLLEIPLQIIEKYRGKAKDNHVFPVMTNQRMNSYLKEIADVCGVDKNLTFHLARHTFGTLMVSLGVPFDSVSKMMGHTNMKTTMIYARITNKKIGEDMDKIADRLKGLGGTLANMPDEIKNSVDANTHNKSDAKRGKPRKQQPANNEDRLASDSILPASNPVQSATNIPVDVKSIQYADGKMIITCNNGQTLVLNASVQQVSPQEPIIEKPVTETVETVARHQAASSIVNHQAASDVALHTVRKRGRPRKVVEQTTQTVEDLVPTSTRKRGLPRKVVIEQTSLVAEKEAIFTTNASKRTTTVQDPSTAKRQYITDDTKTKHATTALRR